MKLRRSARTILATLFVLLVFTLATIWHNRGPGEANPSIPPVVKAGLGEQVTELETLLTDFRSKGKQPGIYVLVPNNDPAWPSSLTLASYRDPLADWIHAGEGQMTVRYRSLEDLLRCLTIAETTSPGSLSTLQIDRVELISEQPLSPSLRMLVSMVLGLSGVWFVKWASRRKTPPQDFA